jgi:flavodoxin
MPDVSGYDVVFVGYPIWWGDLPMPCYTFFDKVKLEGKTIAPFCTHEGSGLSGTDSNIANATKAKVTEALVMKGSVAQNSRDEAKKEVTDWLKKLGYVK